MKKEYILCAAIERKKPRDCKPYLEGNNDICKVELGYQYHDIIQRFGEDTLNLREQGFYTSKGRFVNPIEAMEIALKAKQVTLKVAIGGVTCGGGLVFNMLIPEDLYGN